MSEAESAAGFTREWLEKRGDPDRQWLNTDRPDGADDAELIRLLRIALGERSREGGRLATFCLRLMDERDRAAMLPCREDQLLHERRHAMAGQNNALAARNVLIEKLGAERAAHDLTAGALGDVLEDAEFYLDVVRRDEPEDSEHVQARVRALSKARTALSAKIGAHRD